MEQVQSQEMRQDMRMEMRQALRMEQARLLEMPEDEFHRLIKEIEHSPIFKVCQREKLIRYQRFPGTGISSSFYPVKEEAIAGGANGDVETLLLGKEQLVTVIKGLGEAKFKRYFLYPESALTSEEIACECGMEVARVQQINELVDRLSVLSELSHGTDAPAGIVHYAKVASIDRDTNGFVIGYLSAHLARGRYSVDYEGFERLRAAGNLAAAEARELRHLFRKLELINHRDDALTRILQGIIEKQALYLESGKGRSLLPYSQKELAANIGVAPSTVSRAVSGRSVATPWGAEVPLKHFFPGPKRFKTELLRQLLEQGAPASDEAMRMMLLDRFGVAISRRSVANLRHELKYPAGRGRGAR